jgi:hypothetical protein
MHRLDLNITLTDIALRDAGVYECRQERYKDLYRFSDECVAWLVYSADSRGGHLPGKEKIRVNR